MKHYINVYNDDESRDISIRDKMKLGNIKSINNNDNFNVDIQGARNNLNGIEKSNNNNLLGSTKDFVLGLAKGTGVVSATSFILDAQRDPYTTLTEQLLQKTLTSVVGIAGGVAGGVAAAALVGFIVSNPAGWVLGGAALIGGAIGGQAAAGAVTSVFTAAQTNRANEIAQINREFQAKLNGVAIVGVF